MTTLNDGGRTLREFFSTDVFTIKAIAALAMLLAVRAILGLPYLTIYIGPFRLITFAYITDALAVMYFGPIAGLAFGFLGDLLGFVASSGAGGGYFPGYAVSEMMTCFLFACFFFRKKITLPRVIIAWLLNLGIVILGLNSLWLMLTMVDAGAMQVFTLARVGNHALQAPLHILILSLLLTRLERLKLERYLR